MKLKGQNWHCEKHYGASWRIFRRRPKHITKRGETYLGWMHRLEQGWQLEDLGHNKWGAYTSMKCALEAFAAEMLIRHKSNEVKT